MENTEERSCYLCGEQNFETRPGAVRDNANLKILECKSCGLVSLSSFDHILPGHYEDSGMHDDKNLNIDQWVRDTHLDDKRRYDLLLRQLTNRRVLDFGCGNGGFLRLAQGSAAEVAGIELERALQPFFKSCKLNVFSSLSDVSATNAQWDLITAFHVVEHLVDPVCILRDLSLLLSDSGRLIIEVPNSNDALLTMYNCDAFQKFTYWSQHLFLFNSHTIYQVCRNAGLEVEWVKHVQRYPLTNHLRWLSEGRPGGHVDWNFLNRPELDSEYEKALASVGMTDTIIVGAKKAIG